MLGNKNNLTTQGNNYKYKKKDLKVIRKCNKHLY